MSKIKKKRNRRIIELVDKGLSNRVVAKVVGVHHSIVIRVKKRGY